MNLNNLLEASAFSPKSLQPPNAWIGHVPFAAWVTKEVEPNVFVELGTHTGNSYFSFCQAIVENNFSTNCYAVDTWQGDEHAGRYDNEVFAHVNAYHQKHYAGFSKLLRMTFDEAVTAFEDKSIELLHIDGLHTYEAVRHDFETWLPKLAPGAIVLFHDTHVRERDFGVWKLWEELQAHYPNNLEFMHSNGLGVLQLNDAPDEKKLHWLEPNSDEKQKLITYFSALGSRQLERFELNKLNLDFSKLNLELSRLNNHIRNVETELAARGEVIGQLEQSFANLETDWAARGNQIIQLEQSLANLETDWAARGNQIIQLEAALMKQQNPLYAKCLSYWSYCYSFFTHKKNAS
ncbi:MAG: class I SAM-dependent methyltransferase [Methylobacter sp.]|nr:class I SAM-dependent methyltransferase [Methylobacter sp.]MDP2428661.1 class I SAM-dependent methyltransferase [Methylobacter sp.]MDP3055136.1 class I SAM-dependent methyltransferase [Methylobacter sp.]MDP3364207.1 class I SAM-dependent methyltransferase [Methylobacter sp.]MDZ4217439.1 class I SAM-dependent methyltransferase [Methylobacter sp.]